MLGKGLTSMLATSQGKLILAVICMAAFCLAASPLASATSFTLSDTNLTGVTNVGTVVITDTGTDQVTVSITMNAGFSLKLQGGQIGFNGPSGLVAASAGNLTGYSGANTYSGLNFNGFKTDQNISQFGTFAFDYTNIQGSPNGVVSVDSLTFTLTAPGLLASQFTGVVVHFCTASGTDCGPLTGFASNGPGATVPEPGTITLLGSGLIGLAGLVRRRIRG
jgi:PEP-CTERM motif-containing protein